jgi:shikimate dehydrogenase
MGAIHLGLLGYPLGHSLSPSLHQAALRAAGLKGDYHLYPLTPAGAEQGGLSKFLEQVRTGQIHGLNITIPYKQKVIAHLDLLTGTAAAIGAVNTVYKDRGLLVGENTDSPGYYQDLNKVYFQETGLPLEPGVCLLLGAGGAARAIAYSHVINNWQVRVATRRFEQAQQLAEEIGKENGSIAAVHWPPDLQVLEDVTLIVNATPLGMHLYRGQSPWPDGLLFPPGAFLYDLVYNPPVTALVGQARKVGLAAVSGLGMLVRQAALAFSLWTGEQTPYSVMFQVAEQMIQAKGA